MIDPNYMKSPKPVVLITGANGIVAKYLKEELQYDYEIRLLTRQVKNDDEFLWDIKNGILDPKALQDVAHVVHLAGASIAEKRWTQKRKREIISSRVDSAKIILENCKKLNLKFKSFISASAIGFYGPQDESVLLTENSPKGNDFLSDVVELWENSADEFLQENIADRVVKLRFGMVLSEEGALQKLSVPIKNYIGANLGDGKQIISWIHVLDLVKMIRFSIERDDVNGVYNAVSPNSVSHKDFTKVLANVLGKPLILPNVPAFVLKTVLGEMSTLILDGQKVSAEKIQKLGFKFQFEDLKSALQNLIKRKP